MIARYTLPAMGKLFSDEHRLEVMLQVELLVLEAQAKLGQVPVEAVEAIRKRAKLDLSTIEQKELATRHDVIAFIESLEDRVGPYGRYLHYGLTSSDVLDTSWSVLLRHATQLLLADVNGLLAALAKQARRHKKTLMIGRTHGVHAEPMTFGLKMAMFYDEFSRHRARLERVLDEISVGKISGAVGTFANVDPSVERYVCAKLGLKPAPISTQVVQRDLHASYVTALALVGAGLEQLATEIRNLQRTEIREVEEPFGPGQKGSSAMPHKKNPVTCERVSGLARLLRGYSIAAMENVSLWHERDITHSSVERVMLPDASILLDYMLQTMSWVIDGLVVNADAMRENLFRTRGIVFSGQVLLRLMEQGLSRTQAYELVQRAALDTWKNGRDFLQALTDNAEIRKHLSIDALKRCVDPSHHVRHVDEIFRRVGLSEKISRAGVSKRVSK